MTDKRALIVDDEPDIRELLEITLGRMGLDTASAADLAEAHSLLQEGSFDVCLTDMRLPDGNGIDLVRHISRRFSELPVAVITAHGSMDAAIEALKAGAFDFVSKPVDLAQLRNLVDQALKLQPMEGSGPTRDDDGTKLVGNSPAMQRLRKQVAKLARSQAPIYIYGESGSGKEVVARSIHDQGPRAVGPFVPVNCGAIPGELMESEFFGHRKGAFTGAVSDKEGLFQAANGGTLFLDEVADLPLPMQVKLLRAIQEKAVRPVGSQQEIAIDVRILSATHKDLARLVERGDFRQDLYYRINVIELRVPPLRERREDIEFFARRILANMAKEWDTPPPSISAAALQALQDYGFPGNVRELENILERAYTLCEDDCIEVPDLHFNPAAQASPSTSADVAEPARMQAPPGGDEPDHDPETAPPDGTEDVTEEGSLEDYLESLERRKITEALEATRWNKTAAAKRLGITFRALRYRLKKLGME
ncbi:MAG: sigma-54 dependent transcriptional regulator [Pseudomonadales bacterium]|jgi:two-component system response regulator PilR (NtrC family)|nr:sigma-54 dependent transcriptional regulator [Pseudomonadales bacterium]